MDMVKLPLIFNLIISTLAGFLLIDYTTGTIKNQILSGNKRSHIYLAKLIVFSKCSNYCCNVAINYSCS